MAECARARVGMVRNDQPDTDTRAGRHRPGHPTTVGNVFDTQSASPTEEETWNP